MKAILISLMTMFILSGCGEKQSTEPKAEPVSVDGSWSGVGKSSRGTSFVLEFTVSNEKGTVSGNASAQLAGSIVKSYYSVTGTLSGKQVHLAFDVVYIKFDGTVNGGSMTGKLTGLSVTDGPATFTKK
jgi:hypothetical protein